MRRWRARRAVPRAGRTELPAGPSALTAPLVVAGLCDYARPAQTLCHDVDAEPDTPLLWVIREQVGLTGTKYGCGVAACGACSVHLNGEVQRSCVIPLSAVKADDKIVTIEGLSADRSHPVQRAWAALEVAQCGYCQSGQIMAAAALLAKSPAPTDADIDAAMTNICRCGTYQRIRAAVHMAAGTKTDLEPVPAGPATKRT